MRRVSVDRTARQVLRCHKPTRSKDHIRWTVRPVELRCEHRLHHAEWCVPNLKIRSVKMAIAEISPFDRSPFVTSGRTSITFLGGFATCRPRNTNDESRFVFLSCPSDAVLLE